MLTPIDYQKVIREAIIETLLPEVDDVVGDLTSDPHGKDFGWWILLGGQKAFLGRSFTAALVTANLGDWLIYPRDGYPTKEVIAWFDVRAHDPDWKRLESPEQRKLRRERITLNTELTMDELVSHTEVQDPGIPLTSEQFDKILEETPPSEFLVKLREFELIEIEGQPGIWILDEDVERFLRVSLLVREDGYCLSFGESLQAQTGMQLRTYAKLKMDADQNLVYLKVFSPNQSKPSLVIKKKGNGLRIDRFEIR
jgi:hypothetical protein